MIHYEPIAGPVLFERDRGSETVREGTMLRIAVAQTPGNRLDQWPRAHQSAEELVRRAAARNADLVLLPECVWPAYFLESTDAYVRARRAGMPGDTWFLAQLGTWARENRIAICAGYVAECGARLRNAACLMDESGQLRGTYEKSFLWDFDQDFFEAGDSIEPVDSDWGPVGIMICADARLPEIPATLAACGARLLLQPTAWVNVGTPTSLWNPQPDYLIAERAREFGVPIASASKWGVEGDTTFVGSSLICDAGGNVLAQCGTRETAVAVADVTLMPPQRPKLSRSLREQLLTRRPVEFPRTDVPHLRVVLLNRHTRAGDVMAKLGREKTSAPTQATLLLSPARGMDASGVEPTRGENTLVLTGPSEQPHDFAGVRIGAVHARDAIGFAAIRALALRGAHAVVVFGEGVPARTLRSRATENRIFLIHVYFSRIVAYGPRGNEVGSAPGLETSGDRAAIDGSALTLSVLDAADKNFAPRTNPFLARRPELYTL